MEGNANLLADFENPYGLDYGRTVVKAAPTCFTLEVLPPVKHGKAYSYGVRVIPVNPQQIMQLRDAEDTMQDSISIRSVGREYEIWRRWDDCLDFQWKLEREFERMSREKKRLLRSAKKGATLYSNPKAGASFESLPEGPDPKAVKVDLHAHVPRLSKKSSFFGSESDATVQKRGEEFAATIYALFKADCVKLLEELRDSVTVRDFFAWWKRDEERMEKLAKRPTSAVSKSRSLLTSRSESRASLDTSSSTVFTSPPSPDSPGFSMLKRQEKLYVHPQRSPTDSWSPTSTSSSVVARSPQPHTLHLPSPPTSPEHVRPSRSPVPFGVRPGVSQQPLSISRPMQHPAYSDSGHSLLSPLSPPHVRAAPVPVTSALYNHSGRPFNSRTARQVVQSGESSSDSSTTPPITPTRTSFLAPQVRERPVSQMSMESIDSADFDIDLSFIKLNPAPPGQGKARANGPSKRDSIASISSFISMDSIRTTNSVEGVLPQALRRHSRVPRSRHNGPWSPDSRLSVAVPEEAEAGQYYSDDDFYGGGDDLESNFDTMSFLDNLDSFPGVPAPPAGTEDDAMLQYSRDRDWRMSFPTSISDSIIDSEFDLYDVTEPSSPTSTIHGVPLESEGGHSNYSAGSNGTVIEPGMCSVKAKFDDIIVALRLPLGTPLSTLRARLSEKFLQAQGIRLHYRFALAYLPPRRVGSTEGVPILLSPAALEFGRSASGSRDSIASTLRPRDSVTSSSQLTRIVPIWSQDDWETALDKCNNKVVLHIIDQDLSR